MTHEEQLRADVAKVLADVREAIVTGREPEDVQRERHARELNELHRRPTWWEYVAYYCNPVRLAQQISGTEWSECWQAWPHCCGQAGCWMHYSDPPTRWCGCRCRWCRIARLIRRDLP